MKFPPKTENVINFRLQRLCFEQKIRKFRGSGKKCKKPPFLVILGQKGQFWPVLAKMAKTVKIIKKALGTFFSRLQALTKCKVSEKVMSGFREKALRTDERTKGRTDIRTRLLRSQTTVGRETNYIQN